MAKPNLGELRAPVEQAIDALRKEFSPQRLRVAWAGLVAFWDCAGEAEVDAEGEPDDEGAHFALCYRLVAALRHVNFDAETEDGEDYLRTAALDVFDHLNSGDDEPILLSKGSEGELDDGTFLATDLLEGSVIFKDDGEGFAPKPLRRTAPKIGRNEKCPCGSARKFKKCCMNAVVHQVDDL